jgi:hypothetical protein
VTVSRSGHLVAFTRLRSSASPASGTSGIVNRRMAAVAAEWSVVADMWVSSDFALCFRSTVAHRVDASRP